MYGSLTTKDSVRELRNALQEKASAQIEILLYKKDGKSSEEQSTGNWIWQPFLTLSFEFSISDLLLILIVWYLPFFVYFPFSI